MNTMARLQELADERDLTMFQLAQLCSVNYCTLKNTANRNGQLSVDTIEQICVGLRMPLSAFFVDSGRSNRI